MAVFNVSVECLCEGLCVLLRSWHCRNSLETLVNRCVIDSEFLKFDRVSKTRFLDATLMPTT